MLFITSKYCRSCRVLSYYFNFRTSLQYGISCLKRLNYDRNALEERRKNCENALADVLVWSNERLIRWVAIIGLKVYYIILTKLG